MVDLLYVALASMKALIPALLIPLSTRLQLKQGFNVSQHAGLVA